MRRTPARFQAQQLPEAQQDELAKAIRAEIEAEDHWENRLATPADALGALADEALAEHRSGRTRPLDPDERRTPEQPRASGRRTNACLPAGGVEWCR